MQTFVLAPQSPKKYYVHNDIFRYEDEVFGDSEAELDEGKGAQLLIHYVYSVAHQCNLI